MQSVQLRGAWHGCAAVDSSPIAQMRLCTVFCGGLREGFSVHRFPCTFFLDMCFVYILSVHVCFVPILRVHVCSC